MSWVFGFPFLDIFFFYIIDPVETHEIVWAWCSYGCLPLAVNYIESSQRNDDKLNSWGWGPLFFTHPFEYNRLVCSYGHLIRPGWLRRLTRTRSRMFPKKERQHLRVPLRRKLRLPEQLQAAQMKSRQTDFINLKIFSNHGVPMNFLWGHTLLILQKERVPWADIGSIPNVLISTC